MTSTSLRSLLFVTTFAFRALAQDPETPPVELKLGDDFSRPVVVRTTIPASAEAQSVRVHFVLTTTAPHKVLVAAFASEPTRVSLQDFGAEHQFELRASAPLKFWVSSKPNTEIVVVAFSPIETQPSSEDVFSRPSASAKVSERTLRRHSVIPLLQRAHLGGGVSHASATLARDLFTTIDRSLVLYATDTTTSRCGLAVGEPVLLLDVRVMQPNGRVTECASNVEDYLSTTPPSTLVLPAPEQPVLHTYNTWDEEEFAGRAATDPRIAKYLAKKAIARECDIKTWEKLDPSGRASHYDVISYDAKGKVKSVEGYGDKLSRQVTAQCHEDALFKERDLIRAAAAKTFVAEEKKRLEEIKRRLEAP